MGWKSQRLTLNLIPFTIKNIFFIELSISIAVRIFFLIIITIFIATYRCNNQRDYENIGPNLRNIYIFFFSLKLQPYFKNLLFTWKTKANY